MEVVTYRLIRHFEESFRWCAAACFASVMDTHILYIIFFKGYLLTHDYIAGVLHGWTQMAWVDGRKWRHVVDGWMHNLHM